MDWNLEVLQPVGDVSCRVAVQGGDDTSTENQTDPLQGFDTN